MTPNPQKKPGLLSNEWPEHRFTRLRNIIRSCYEGVRAFLAAVRSVHLSMLNRYGRATIVSADGPVVSLTTFGRRVRTVHITVESIARGKILPSRLILWIDDPTVIAHLPAGLRRLQTRGLEVIACPDYGPHKKHFPYITATHTFDKCLVTADDDIIYPRRWLESLVRAHNDNPDVVTCYRARVIGLNGRAITSYNDWKKCRNTRPCYRHFSTGVSGVLYPTRFLHRLKESGQGFEETCPRADDIWLNVQALRAGFKVRQLGIRPVHFLTIPGSQSEGLFQENMLSNGNDLQISLTYTREDVERMLSDA